MGLLDGAFSSFVGMVHSSTKNQVHVLLGSTRTEVRSEVMVVRNVAVFQTWDVASHVKEIVDNSIVGIFIKDLRLFENVLVMRTGKQHWFAIDAIVGITWSKCTKTHAAV